MRVSGGQANNALWNQLKADVTGVSLQIPRIRDGELAGDAIIAFSALGVYSSLQTAAARIARVEYEFEPQKERSEYYSAIYRRGSRADCGED